MGRICIYSIEGTVPVPPRASVSHVNTGEHEDHCALDPVLHDPP